MRGVSYRASRRDWRVQWGGRHGSTARFRSQAAAEAFALYVLDPRRPGVGHRGGARRPAALADRIRRSVQIDENGCWRWKLGTKPAGYGLITVSRRRRLAHRVSYETFVGAIPDGLQLDHLCRVRDCVNPAHLEPVSGRENVMRSPITVAALNSAKTHCPSGHPYDESNTYVWRGERICRTCRSERRRTYRLRRQMAVAA